MRPWKKMESLEQDKTCQEDWILLDLLLNECWIHKGWNMLEEKSAKVILAKDGDTATEEVFPAADLHGFFTAAKPTVTVQSESDGQFYLWLKNTTSGRTLVISWKNKY